MRRITLLICTLCVTMGVLAIPADPRLLHELLANGDTARYEQMLHQSQAINSRRPKHPLIAHTPKTASGGARKQFGVTSTLADRGLLILVNFADKSFLATNTQAQLDSMMNAYSYTYDGATGSAAQYYNDQSNGTYRPHFDVVGPVTLPNNASYYGSNDAEGNDVKSGDMVLHACSIASQIDGVNLADYDADGDGEIDFVYIIYAGKGEADGGSANTIWPASWDMESTIYGGFTSLSPNSYGNKSLYSYDGVAVGNYAYSSEQAGHNGRRSGIGTPTHEFGHVLGLPDLYDIYYGTNYDNAKTPGDWDIMDCGSYNNGGKTPPNLSPWEKAFFGWATPVNPGNTGADLTLYPNGSTDYNIYQINASGEFQDHLTGGTVYLIENRQQTGWDTYIPGHGMLIWRLKYNPSYWEANEPNSSYDREYTIANSQGTVCYTIVPATGSATNIGSGNDPFPGRRNITEWTYLEERPLTDICENDSTITLKYMGGTIPTEPTEPTEPTTPENPEGPENPDTPDTSTGLTLTPANELRRMYIVRGHLYIRHGDNTYDLLGKRL